MSRPLGWIDLGLFGIFEDRHIAADQEYLYKFNSEKPPCFDARSRRMHCKVCIFKKLQKPYINFSKIHKYLSFTLKNN